jgi:hypothetical protein
MNVPRKSLQIAGAIILAVAFAISLAAQSPAGPTNLPGPPDVIRLPNRPAAEKAPLAPEEIIKRFGQYEDGLLSAIGGFTYRRTIRLEEFGGDGKASGRAESVTQMTVEPDGTRRFRPSGRTESTLHSTELEPDVLEALGRLPTFPFSTSQLSKYEFTYQAAEPVDDLMTYVFRVTPRQVSRTTAYFSGVIWVDDRDYAVVKSFGKWVTETGDVKLGELPFSFFETYRQYVSDKYWLPAYMSSDGALSKNGARVPLRLTIRWDDFKPITGVSAPTSTAPPTDPQSAAPAPASTPPQPIDSDRPTLGPRKP